MRIGALHPHTTETAVSVRISSRQIVGVAVVTGMILMLLHVFFCREMYRDVANCYAYMAREFAAGRFETAFHPSIPPLNVALAGLLAWCGMEAFSATIVVSGMFYVLTVFPLFGVLRRFFPERLAAMGVLLYVCAPKIIRFSTAGLLESGKIFFVVFCLWSLFRLLAQWHSLKNYVWLGIGLGGLSLVRGEGIGLAAALFGCGILSSLLIRKKQQIPWPGLILRWVLAGVLWMAVMGPRILSNYSATGYPVPDQRIAVGILQRVRLKTVNPDIRQGKPAQNTQRISIGKLIQQNLRGGYEVYMALAGLGLLLLLLSNRFPSLWSRGAVPEFVRFHPEWWILLAVFLCNSFIHFISIAAYRYFLVNIPLLMVLTLIGGYWFWAWFSRWVAQWILVLLFLGMLALQIINGVENLKDDSQYRSGLWLKEHFSDFFRREGRLPVVWFSNASPEWFYSGFDRAIPIESGQPDLRKFQKFDLAIARNKDPENDFLRKRPDLTEVKMPSFSTIKVYRKRMDPHE